MNENLTRVPHEIERKSFEIITSEMGETSICAQHLPIVKRVIHTTADFSFAELLGFSHHAVTSALQALQQGATIITDTNMACVGISKPALAELGCRAVCFVADEDVAQAARASGTTRSVESVNKARSIEGPVIFAIGNAPTALLRISELVAAKKINPALVIGVPVGFVNVIESKQALEQSGAEYIVSRGRKGGSTIATAICNALLYGITRKELLL